MTTHVSKLLSVGLAAGLHASAGTPPEMELANGAVRLRLYLPDAEHGFYRGTRFDWSGVMADLAYAGHHYYPQWFDRIDPDVHDFIYDGNDIVASPCTAITGPAEEFSTQGKGLGYDEAEPGQTFIKIGVGVLQKPDAKPYDPYRLYAIKDGGKWTVTRKSQAIEFRQEVADPSTGYAYDYRKTVSLEGERPVLVLDHTLRNTGKRVLETSVYNHNFLFLDRQPPGPDFTITLPFMIRTTQTPGSKLAVVRENRISFAKTLSGEESVYLVIGGFGTEPADYDIRVENRRLGAGLRITADRPLSRAALWAIRAPLSFEPFIDMKIEPGTEFTWRIQYEHYTTEKTR